MIFEHTPSRAARLLTAASVACLVLAAPALAENSQGKRLDNSHTFRHPAPPNTEREASGFDALPPSAFTREERRAALQATVPVAPAQASVTLEDELNAATFESGQATLTAAAKARLDALAQTLRGKSGLRFEVIGHTDDQQISARLRAEIADNQALSEARALSVAEHLGAQLALGASAFAVRGQGMAEPAAANDTPEGRASNRRTVIRVWYAQTATQAPTAALHEGKVAHDDCLPSTTAIKGLPFSISVDGRPLGADSVQTEADRQRCVDVALDRADIQVKYDPLNVAPALNVWAAPAAAGSGQPVLWRTYANYAWWVKRAEIRVFRNGQATTERPLAVVPVQVGGEALWRAPSGLSGDIGYLLRVYDEAGRFDETALKGLQLLDNPDPAEQARRAEREALSGYGESSLKIRNIPVSGGSVTISGERVKAGESVAAFGAAIPVDEKGRFATRQILPAGSHAVDVAVTSPEGQTATFTRNLQIADKDWFYVAVADLTAANGRTTGPAGLVTSDLERYDKKTTFDGRLAFYLKGKVLGRYLLTASADTREQPLEDLFSNFASKDPSYLLRRIDPNRYYPVYGDDSVIADDAPTQGKFYVRLERDASSVMWGNFQTAWTGTELTQYSRGLYGGELVWNSQATTDQGERRTTVNAFAAEPGTLQSREEFRGTGGSLYYLRRQDLTEGSERLWVEIRDKDSGLVLHRTMLAPSQDYEIDYLQGRLILRSPLPTVADGGALVQTDTFDGNPVYLVASYEYVPGLTKVEGNTIGLRASHWLTNWLRVGGTYYTQGDGGMDQDLGGLDATLRYAPGTWLSAEVARSKGVGLEALTSNTGGFDFSQNLTGSKEADAYRLDAAIDLSDLDAGWRGRLSGYVQDREDGFAGPGLITPNGEQLRQAGFAVVLPVGARAELAVKVDDRAADSLSAESQEIAFRYKLNPEWGVSLGARHDKLKTAESEAGEVVNASPTLSRNGGRSDGVLRVDYRPLKAEQPAAVRSADASPGVDTAPAPDSARYLSKTELGVSAPANGPAGSLVPTVLGRSSGVMTAVADPVAAAGVAAAPLAGYAYQPWNIYGFVQQTLSRSGARPDNDRGGVGAGWQVNDRLRLGAEVSGGDGGTAGKLAADYSPDDRSNLYLTYARETEVPDQSYAGRQGVLTAGGRMRLTDQLGLFAESRAASGEGPHSLTHGFGVDFAPAKQWTSGLRLDTGRLTDPVSGDLKRFAVSLNLGYRDEDLKAAATVEYRRDKTDSLGSPVGVCATDELQTDPCVSGPGPDERDTMLFKGTLSYQLDPAWRMLGNVNLSRSSSSQGAFYDGDYTEIVVGSAYRPVDNDRWNTLFKYTYFYNLPSAGQVDNVNNSVLDYTQKSHVLNVDTIYDVLPWLSVGAKYGLRIGELRASRTAGDWYDSQAQLFVLRSDLHFVKSWDAVVELRRLSVEEADDSRSGALVAVYRHIGEHGKLGAGYNFTDFSDDLTDLSYRSRGFFINALATF
jgi:outer membrane protein OmpA-like peptidoglycan-associated protein